MARHLLSLIKEIRPKRALFTTYTFNVPFFDAAVLPALANKDGCEISVLVDGRQMAAGVMGAFSQDAGLRYALAPVKAPGGGIFHPKLAFFENDEEQYLCVGSGNLTLAGLSHQLECWDVVECSKAPDTLADFASFLMQLEKLITRSSPRAAAILRKTGLRAGAATRTEERERLPGPRLIHTLSTSAAVQLVAEFQTQPLNAKRLTVLSPFHTVNGEPVKRLAKAIGAAALRIGHDGNATFERSWYPHNGPNNKFVTPKPADSRGDEGKLHAKVYELQAGDKTLVMTGSVNATHQSLETTKNVEVSLARWYKTSPFKWNNREPDKYEAVKFPESLGTGLLVEATLQLDGYIAGMISAAVALPEAVMWSVTEGDRLHEEGECNIGEDGGFRFLLKAPCREAHFSLRLEVRAGDRVGLTWLNNEQALRQASTGLRVDKRLLRAIQGAADIESLNYITGILNRALQGQPIRVSISRDFGSNADKAPTDEADSPFYYEEWLQSGTLRSQSQAVLGDGSPDFLKAVYELLYPKPVETETTEEESVTDEVLGKTDAEIESARRKALSKDLSSHKSKRPPVDLKKILAKSCLAIQESFDQQRTGICSPVTLALVVSAHELRKAEDRWKDENDKKFPNMVLLWDPQKAFILWLERLCRYPFDEEERQILLPIACGLACIAAYWAPPTAESGPYLVRLPTLKCFLRRLANRQLEDEEFPQLVRAGLLDELFSRLDPLLREQTIQFAEQLAKAPYLDDALIAHIGSVVQGQSPDSADELAFPAVHMVLKDRGNPLDRIGIVEESMVRNGGCITCGLHFNEDERSALKYCRVVQHPGMRPPTEAHLLIYPEDPARLRAEIKRLRNV